MNTVSKHYHHQIKKRYDQIQLPSNIVFFTHSYTGFLWNPKNITLHKEMSLFEMFQKAKNHKVVLIDDPVEIELLSQKSNGNQAERLSFTPVDFQRLIQKSSLLITDSDFSQLFLQQDFSFSYIWSGEALDFLKKHPTFHFTIHDNLSFISTDLLALLNNDPKARCVAEYMASKEFLTYLQNTSNYFSPFGNYEDIQDLKSRSLHKKFHKQLPKYAVG